MNSKLIPSNTCIQSWSSKARIRITTALFMTLAHLNTAQGFEMSVRAEFKPDSSKPFFNKFENKTPNSGYCKDYPNECKSSAMFSLRAPIVFNSIAPITANHADPRQGASFSLPTQWRDFTVSHSQTLEQETVRIRIKGFGSTYVTPSVIDLVGGGVTDIAAHYLLWGTGWVYAPANCSYSGVGYYGYNFYNFFWKTPVQAPCQKQARFNIPWMKYSYLDFAYEIETPNPLGMSSGDYVGNFIYTVGPGQDFDMGDVMIPADPTLSLNFTLNVQHTLKVDIPPGGEKVELLPTGGWQQWLQKGRTPEKLYHDQTFLISASSRFKMQLACERVIGDACAISNNSNDHAVPVDVRVSMPNGIGNDDGSAVSREKLSTATEQVFQSTHYVDQKPSMLHFEIQKQYVSEMLSEQGKYSGDITVVWDSDV